MVAEVEARVLHGADNGPVALVVVDVSKVARCADA